MFQNKEIFHNFFAKVFSFLVVLKSRSAIFKDFHYLLFIILDVCYQSSDHRSSKVSLFIRNKSVCAGTISKIFMVDVCTIYFQFYGLFSFDSLYRAFIGELYSYYFYE